MRGAGPAGSRFSYLGLCPLATRNEWIFNYVLLLRSERRGLSKRLAYRGVELVADLTSRKDGERTICDDGVRRCIGNVGLDVSEYAVRVYVHKEYR